MQGFIPYTEFFKHLPIQPGDFIYLASDLRKLVYQGKKHKLNFDPQIFIASLKAQLGAGGTIIIPTFNYNLQNGDAFDILHTPPITGTLPAEALKDPEFTRTQNPMHSFAVWGKYKSALLALENRSSFGPDSPFQFMHDHHCQLVGIDVDLQQSLTFAHYSEEAAKVSYRKNKAYVIHYTDANGQRSERSFSIYAKKPGYVNQVNPMLGEFKKAGILSSFEVNGVPCFVLDLRASHGLMLQELQQHQAGKMTYFSLNIFFRSMLRSMLGK